MLSHVNGWTASIGTLQRGGARVVYRPVGLYNSRVNVSTDNRAEITRERILETAADEMYRSGYQAASIGQMLKQLGISKGCFYHHFQTKAELGYAVIDELYGPGQKAFWDDALAGDDPLSALIELLRCMAGDLKGEKLVCGCPINNLAQEMSPLDEGFRTRLERIYRRWHQRLTEAFLRAQRDGRMADDVDVAEVASFVMATTQGATGMAKNAQDNQVFTQSVRGLVRYLEGLQIKVA